MQGYVITSLLFCFFKYTASEIHTVNASWNQEFTAKCSHDLSLIYIKEALLGLQGEKGGPTCTIPVGRSVRNFCNGRNSCKFNVYRGHDFDPDSVKCTSEPNLYVKYVCINKGASIIDLTDSIRTLSGNIKPAGKAIDGYRSVQAAWTELEYLCPNYPRFVRFELVDINFVGDCHKQNLSIQIHQKPKLKTFGPFCETDLDKVPPKSRVSDFINVTKVAFNFHTKKLLGYRGRGFLLNFIGMQCRPVPQRPNTDVVYSQVDNVARARVFCRNGFLPRPGTPNEVTATCHGHDCADDCDEVCDYNWKKDTDSRSIGEMKCVLPSALTTTISTTTLSSTAASTRTTQTSASSVHTTPSGTGTSAKIPKPPTRVAYTTPPRRFLPPQKPGHKDDEHVVLADPSLTKTIKGVIGGVVGAVGCLIVGILILMVCRKTGRDICPSCCFDRSFYDKTSYAGSQAVSHAGTARTFGDSTLALRYRPPSTISTHVGNTTLASVNRSSVGSSILFPSTRRSKRKTLPHPSTLGYGPYDETAPLFPESPREGVVFSPSVETYLEPDRRPSASALLPTERAPIPPPSVSTFVPKPTSGPRGEYQVYDETRSSRNALDRFDAPRPDPRQSMALISNHYYCRGEGSDDDRNSGDSVYEVVEEGHASSVHTTPCETRRHFPAATLNDYVQPPELPARPATMSRSQQELPAAPTVSCDDGEEEDGYQPVNCANRIYV